jgi:AraC-like DNA-binding protein
MTKETEAADPGTQMGGLRRGATVAVRPSGWSAGPARYPCRLVRWKPSGGGVMRSTVRFVDAYQTRYEDPLTRTLFGTTRSVLMLSLDDPVEVVEGRTVPLRGSSLLVGPQTRPLATAMRGAHRGLHVELDPSASLRLFGVPASQLTDEVVEAAAVVDAAWGAELVERLAGCDDPGRMVAMFERAVRTLPADGAQLDPIAAWMWEELVASRGHATIGELVRRSGFSHRHVVARFRRSVGVTPKAAARLLRFEHAARSLAAGCGIADVASTSGYADQSHLTREVVRLSGLTPAALARRSPDGRTSWSRAL